MSDSKPTVFVTGISGAIGSRLYPLLAPHFNVAGADLTMPRAVSLARFETMNLAREASCDAMIALFREVKPAAVLHLAPTAEYPNVTEPLDEQRWQASVAGTARVMEAVAVYNRLYGHIGKYLHLSSARVYGSTGEHAATEQDAFNNTPLLSMRHQQESDQVVCRRAAELGECSVSLLRPQWLTGPGMHNLMLDTLLGVPTGSSPKAERLRQRGKRLPLWLPLDCDRSSVLQQFLHVDDLLRLVLWLLQRDATGQACTVLNVAGSGMQISLEESTSMAALTVKRAPLWWARRRLHRRWEKNISTVPPEAFELLTSSSLTDCSALKKLLGSKYASIIRNSSREALEASLPESEESADVAG